MAYCTVGDLLLGEGSLMFDPRFDKEKFVNGAADEINAKLGVIYNLPLTAISPATELPTFQTLLLKNINIKLASGRMYLTIDASGDGARLHSYGLRLVNEAMEELMCLANGEVWLDAVRREETGNDTSRGPAISHHDEESMVDAFENVVHKGIAWRTEPGAL